MELWQAQHIITTELIQVSKKQGSNKEIALNFVAKHHAQSEILESLKERKEHYNQPDLKNDSDFNNTRERLKIAIKNF